MHFGSYRGGWSRCNLGEGGVSNTKATAVRFDRLSASWGIVAQYACRHDLARLRSCGGALLILLCIMDAVSLVITDN